MKLNFMRFCWVFFVVVLFKPAFSSDLIITLPKEEYKSSKALDDKVPLETKIFGFNVPWHNFQRGHMDGLQLSQKVVDYLSPFEGAIYRFPGGDESNLYVWERAVGSYDVRLPIRTMNSGMQTPVFGVDEFLKFVSLVRGIPLYTVNLCGGDNYNNCSEDEAVNSVRNLVVAYGNKGKKLYKGCEPESPCGIKLWELGNELDIGKAKWSSHKYSEKGKAVANAIREVDKDALIIGAMATAPWSHQERSEDPVLFNRTVASRMDESVDGYAFHAYYDGLSIPAIQKELDRSVSAVRSGVKSNTLTVDVYITEHARWPNKPILGDWKQTWSRTKDLGAALSVADYLLTLSGRSDIKGAMLHALGTWGPWQLIESPDHGSTLIPTVLYWGLRTIRTGLEGELLVGPVTDDVAGSYRGGYRVKAVISRRGDGSLALIAVNRSEVNLSIRILGEEKFLDSAHAISYVTSGSSVYDANSLNNPNLVRMRSVNASLMKVNGGIEIALEPLSITAVQISSSLE